MNNVKSTKRAFLSSVLATILCFAMLLGTTFAWFTDSVESGNNIITAGNLDIELNHSNQAVKDQKVTNETMLFTDVTYWEPGVSVWEKFDVMNVGNLDLKYQFTLNVNDATKVGDVSFAELLKVAVVYGDLKTANEITDWKPMETFTLSETLKSDETDTFYIVIWWEPSDIDDLFNMNNGQTTKVGIDVGVSLIATQLNSEADGFGENDYDEDAWVEGMKIFSAQDLQAAINAGERELTLMADIDTDSAIVIPAAAATFSMRRAASYITLNLNGFNLTSTDGVAIQNAGELLITGEGQINGISNAGALVIDGEDTAINTIENAGNLTIENAIIGGNDGSGAITNNGGTVTINGGIIHADISSEGESQVTITGGAINSTIIEGDNVVIEGGIFAGEPDEDHLPDGKTYVKGPEGINYIVDADVIAVAWDQESLQAAIDAATEGRILFVHDIEGDVTITQKPDVKFTIDGADYTFSGVMTVDGKSARYETAGVTIQNVKFEAESLSADAFIRLGAGKGTSVRYTNGVTVKDCIFSYSGEGDIAAVKSYEGGDWNLTLEGLTVNAGMHSMLQVANVEKGLTIKDCTVKSKNGINLNNTPSLEMSGCTFNTVGYAARFGVSGNALNGMYKISNSTLSSACDDGDAVVIFRGNSANSVLALTNVTVKGETLYTGDFVRVTNGKDAEYNWAVTNVEELKAALEQDGPISIKLYRDLVFDKTNYAYNTGTYYDGLYYIGDKDITIDLNGKKITNDSAVNDYLLNFKNEGTRANTITIKNGTIEATSSAYCAIATATTSTQKITINLENVNLIGNNSGGAVAKIRGGAELNVKDGTVFTGKNNYVCIEAVGENTVVNVYDGAKFYQNGTSSYVGSLIGVSYNATVNVYGGYGVSAKGGFIAMTSGGTINVSGGEWIANTDGTYANDNKSVLIAQSESGAKCTINVTGGTFKGGYNCYGATAGDAQIVISNGVFNADPSAYVVDGLKAVENNGKYYITAANVDKVIVTAEDLLALSTQVFTGNNGIAETYTIALMADIDMKGAAFSAIIAQRGDTLNFIGNGYTISNVKVVSGANDNTTGMAAMFYCYPNSTLNISDLTLKNITVTADADGTGYAAAVIGYCEGAAILNNVDVVNATVVGVKSSGAIAGHVSGSLTATGCEISGTVTLAEFAGEAAGHYAAKLIGTVAGNITLNDVTYDVTVSGNLNAKNVGDVYGRWVSGKVIVNGIIPVYTTAELINEIKKAPVGEVTTIGLMADTYEGNIDITVAALGTQGGDVVIKVMGENAVITGTVTLGYRNQGVGSAMYNANVTFDGVTFNHAESGKHSLYIQDVKSLTLINCTIIGDGEYGVDSARGNATGTSKITNCTFENAGMQLLGNYATGLVIDGCTFNESCINVQAGNGVTVQNCEFNNTLTSANVGDSFYAIRSNSTPITVKNCTLNIDSDLTEVATAQAKWYLLANRGTTNWTVENVAVTLTDAALAQTELDITACTSTGKINATNLTVNGVAQ